MKRKKLKAVRKSSEQTVNGRGSGDAPKTPSYTPDDLIDRAEALLEEESEVDAAQRFCMRALEMDDKNVRALRMIGILLLESPDDRSLEAKFCLERAVEQGGSEIGHSSYLYLGQLTEGKESVGFYELGILNLRKKLQEEEGAAGGSETPKKMRWREEPASRRLLSSAHCAVAEIYMTDLCDESVAENECLSNIEAARKTDDTNPEAINLWAAFQLVKQDHEKARDAMVQSLKLWQPALRAVLTQGEAEEEEDQDAETNVEEKQEETVSDVTTATGLNFDARLKCSQTLIELQMLEEAAEVLESCHMENDEDVQVLYLSSIVHFKMWENAKDSEEKAENARTFLNSALEVVQEGEQEEVLEHTREMLEQLGDAGKVEGNGLVDIEPESSGDEAEMMEEG